MIKIKLFRLHTAQMCSHNLQLVTLAQLWELEEEIKMGGSFIGFR